jgi:cytosine/adenosine deaminase-related metal-dependent hydrolase
VTAEPTLVIDGCAIAAVDPAGTEYEHGHIVISADRIVSVGAGPAPPRQESARYVDGRGCLATPGLVNTHHHLYQWATRGLAQDAILFEWLKTLYPIWAGIDEEVVGAAARAALASLALSGCTLSTDHHYIFPRGRGDLLAATITAAREIGLRFHPTRGSMDLGESAGGLPPDSVVEDRDTALAATAEAIDRFHDPGLGAMVRVAIAPCSPFSASGDLMREAAALARESGVRLHTHLAETVEEERYCQELFGCLPVQYMEDLGWLGPDVWMAHCVWLGNDAVRRLAQTGTGVAHCPSSNARLGAGIAPVRQLLDAGAPVGLGVDGAASNEAGELVMEVRQALLMARVRTAPGGGPAGPGGGPAGPGGGPAGRGGGMARSGDGAARRPALATSDAAAPAGPGALTARQALAMATLGGARCLGWHDELGSLEPGKLADIALWRLDTQGHADIPDPVAALVLGPRPPLAALLVGGRTVVEDGELRTGSVTEIAQAATKAAALLRDRARLA